MENLAGGGDAELSIWRPYYQKLFSCSGIIVLYKAGLKCGIVEVDVPGPGHTYCYFLNHNVEESFKIVEGAKVSVKARLVSSLDKVPLLATEVSAETSETPVISDAVLLPIPNGNMVKFHNLAQVLGAKLPDIEIVLQEPIGGRKRIYQTDEELSSGSESSHPMKKNQKLDTQLTKDNEVSESRRIMIPIPAQIVKINKEVTEFDKTQVFMKDGKVLPLFNNITGTVEHVLSDHHAVLKFQPEGGSKFYRALCRSDDVFYMEFPSDITRENFNDKNPYKFPIVKLCWDLTAKARGISLLEIMKAGQEVKLNVVPLISSYPNPAEVHYCSTGVLVGPNTDAASVPVICGSGLNCFEFGFKKSFRETINSLNANGEFVPGIQIKEDKSEKISNRCKLGTDGLYITLRKEYKKVHETSEKRNTYLEEETIVSIPIPDYVNKVKNVKFKNIDSNKIYMNKGKIASHLDNIVGEVEKVLSDHIAVLRFQPSEKSKFYRALATSEDVFQFNFDSNIDESNFGMNNTFKFQTAQACWNTSARMKNTSLFEILKPKQKLKMNVIPLLSNTENEAEVQYCAMGVLVGSNSLLCPVPFEILQPFGSMFIKPFKWFFHDTLKSLNKEANVIKTLETPPGFKGKEKWKNGVAGSVTTLRPEYQSSFKGPYKVHPKVTTSL